MMMCNLMLLAAMAAGQQRATVPASSARTQAAAPSQPEPAILNEAKPALWKVQGVHGTVYLFGTLHVMRKEVHWQTPKVQAAFRSADVLYLEVPSVDDASSLETQALVMKLGLDPEHPLSSKLTKDDIAALDKALKGLGVSGEDQFEPMRPWVVYLTLSILPAVRAGYDPMSGIDHVLSAEAKEQSKPVKGFETIAEQVHLLSDFPEPEQIALLHEEIADLPKGNAELDATVADWTRGDVDKIGEIDNGVLKQKHPELYQKLLVSRNVRIAATLTALLNDPKTGTVFVAIGAGHLAGGDGVGKMLEARGFKVERVE